MKKLIILLLGVILLSACNKAQKVSDDVNVYIVDTAYVEDDQATFFFRDTEEPFEVPLEKCEGVPLTKGTVVLIDEDLNVGVLEDQTLVVYISLGALFAFAVYAAIKLR